jgi:hypothetical protein
MMVNHNLKKIEEIGHDLIDGTKPLLDQGE